MNEYYNKDTFPEYVKLIESQPKISGQDFSPVLFTSVLPNEELEHIKDQFNNAKPEEIDVQGYAGLGTLAITLLNKKEIIEKIEKIASEAVGEELEVLEFGGTRYSPDFGWYPKLGPHYDARPVEMYVFDYHVQSTENWGLFMEGKRFDFGDNEALLFSGTGQVHWREPIQLKENAKIDLIFFWLQHKNPKPLSQEHIEVMKLRSHFITKKIQAPPSLKQEDWWKTIQISDEINKYPDFRKISKDHEDPLGHNTVYRSPINDESILDFYKVYNLKSFSDQYISITETLKNNVVNFMQHVHAEYTIKFENAYFVRHLSSSNNIMNEYKNTSNNKLVSLMIQLTESNCEYLINEKSFKINKNSALTLSPTDQSCKVICSDGNEADLLFFNFSLQGKQD